MSRIPLQAKELYFKLLANIPTTALGNLLQAISVLLPMTNVHDVDR
jgi:hypothetical protein